MYKYTRILPPLAFLMLLFGYGCKKEFTATFVGSYHVVGTITAPGQASQHIDRNDNIQSDGANILLYQGTDYYFDSSASDNTHYQFDVMSGSYNGFLSFPQTI